MLFIIPFVSSVLFCLTIVQISRKFGIGENPRQDRWHKSKTPKFGGVAICLSFSLSILLIFPISNFYNNILIIGLFMFFIGLVDDIITIKPIPKMVSIIVVGIFCFYMDVKFHPSGSIWLSLPLTIFWYAGIINATNIIDNMDGLAAGTSIITLTMMIYFSSYSNQVEIFNIALTLLLCCLGFLIFNFYPAKIFMGDSGSLFIGSLLATLSLEIAASEGKNILATLLFPVLLMAYPIFDTTLVTINRIIQRKPISKGGKDHSSHRLVRLGLSQRATILYLYAISFLFGVLSITFQVLNTRIATSLLVIFSIALVTLGIFISNYGITSNSKVVESHPILNKNIYNRKKQILELFLDSILIVCSFTLSYYLRFEQNTNISIWNLHDQLLPIVIVIKIITFLKFNLYRGFWEYASISDLINVLKASITSTLLLTFLIFITQTSIYSRSVFIIDCMLTFFFVSSLRLFYRLLLNLIKDNVNNESTNRLLIVGTEELSQLLIRYIINDSDFKTKPIGIINTKQNTVGRRLIGVPILGTLGDTISIIEKERITHVITTLSSGDDRILKVKNYCRMNNLIYKNASLKFN